MDFQLESEQGIEVKALAESLHARSQTACERHSRCFIRSRFAKDCEGDGCATNSHSGDSEVFATALIGPSLLSPNKCTFRSTDLHLYICVLGSLFLNSSQVVFKLKDVPFVNWSYLHSFISHQEGVMNENLDSAARQLTSIEKVNFST